MATHTSDKTCTFNGEGFIKKVFFYMKVVPWIKQAGYG
jgi:hypothetical protein